MTAFRARSRTGVKAAGDRASAGQKTGLSRTSHRMRMFLGCAILALSIWACGEQEVGLACSAMTPCPSQLMCAADLPDGYCTESCDTPGHSCGSGGIAAYCAENGSMLRCSVVCIGN